jgi:hypothetical protein
MPSKPPNPIPTHPPTPFDTFLQQQFAEEIVKQGERLDELAKQLFTLELGIPGIYVTALQVVGTITFDRWLGATLSCWFLALAITLFSLFPKSYQVQRQVIRKSSRNDETAGISIEEFYQYSARDKRRLLVLASISFFLGTVFAAISFIH